MTLIEKLRNELPILSLQALDFRQRSNSAYRMWAEDGRRNEKLLDDFFTFHFRSLELADRIKWIDELLEEFA